VKQEIAPRKAALEKWYNEHQSFGVDIKLLFVTAWVVLFPGSKIMHKAFDDLPE
jgi:lipopolysaccharide/colanic/teichoic acid biosynthesis glycosyltransferase